MTTTKNTAPRQLAVILDAKPCGHRSISVYSGFVPGFAAAGASLVGRQLSGQPHLHRCGGCNLRLEFIKDISGAVHAQTLPSPRFWPQLEGTGLLPEKSRRIMASIGGLDVWLGIHCGGKWSYCDPSSS